MFIDGLNCSRFDRKVFEELHEGGLNCVVASLGFWEDTMESLDALARFRDLVRDNSDLVAIARSSTEIEAIAATKRVALLVAYQNTNALSGRIRYAELFADMGVRIMQLTYNNQNEYGGSCYEPNDSGISRAGREIVAEFNKVGILIDLSHVGERTSLDVVEISEKPVAITHANPASLIPHLRNKSDKLIRALAEKGGVMGMATYPNICGDYPQTVDRWSEIIAYAVDLVGIDHIAIGTDHSRNIGVPDLEWMRMGRWSRIVNYGAGSVAKPGTVGEPPWLEDLRTFGLIGEALSRRGFDKPSIDAVMGNNWLRLYRDVFDIEGVKIARAA